MCIRIHNRGWVRRLGECSGAFFLLFFLYALGCESGDDQAGTSDTADDTETEEDSETEEDTTPAELGPEQEESMCGSLEALTGTLKSAGETMEDAPAINGNGGKITVILAEIKYEYGGYLEINVKEGARLAMLLKEETPLEIVDANGDPVPDIEHAAASEVCPEITNGRFVWTVVGANNYLVFGPTGYSEVDITVETVE